MSAPRCQNDRCRRKLRDDGPSMYYCSHLCSTIGTFAYSVDNRTVLYGSNHSPEGDPTAWNTRSSSPITRRARVKEAWDWLDVRAKS